VHETWLRAQQFDQRGIQLAFDADLEAMLLTLDRRDRLDKAITEMATDDEYAAVVRRLGCLRGVSTLTAFGPAVEVGDWHRFTGATIGAYLGLVPTESSSGQQRSQGSITKAGNTHAWPVHRPDRWGGLHRARPGKGGWWPESRFRQRKAPHMAGSPRPVR
jgi:transposase